MLVSYFDQHGYARTKTVPTWDRAIQLASQKALDPKACPVIIATEDGVVIYQVNK